MTSHRNKDIKQLLYPYLFVLKEGPDFKKNLLSYSLSILQVSNETIRSPKKESPKPINWDRLSKEKLAKPTA